MEKEISISSKLQKFSAFLDEEGLIRAKGRIGKNQSNFNAKHPKLPDWKNDAVALVLRSAHKNKQLGGTKLVQNIVQQKIWILVIKKALDQSRASVIPAENAEHNR